MTTNELDADKPDASVSITDLNAFDRDLLAAIVAHDGEPSGLAIKTTLEDRFGYADIGNARLYRAFDTLAAAGLIEKGQIDRRTNSHEVTAAGEALLARHIERLQLALHGRGGDV